MSWLPSRIFLGSVALAICLAYGSAYGVSRGQVLMAVAAIVAPGVGFFVVQWMKTGADGFGRSTSGGST